MSKKRKSQAPVVAAMSLAASTTQDSALLDLLQTINPNAGAAPSVESDTDAAPSDVIDPDLAAAVATVETQDAYNAQPDDKAQKEAQKAADKAVKDAEKKAAKDAAAKIRADNKAAKQAAKDAAKADRERIRAEKKAAKEAEKAAKPPKQPRVKYENKTDLMKARLGERLGEFMVLEVSDAGLTGDELTAKQNETLALIDGMSQKVKNRANFLMTYMHGGGKLNEVVKRAFEVLKSNGKITTGDKGNLHQNLLARPYDVSSARAMGNNTIAMLRHLKVIVAGEKGEYLPNPNSLILMKVNGQLGL